MSHGQNVYYVLFVVEDMLYCQQTVKINALVVLSYAANIGFVVDKTLRYQIIQQQHV